jgi:hypothetical protein
MKFQNPNFKFQVKSKFQISNLKISFWNLIGVWILVLGIFIPSLSHAALLYSSAANEVTYHNQTFVVDWYLDTQGESINSINLELHFTPDILQVVSAEAPGSDLNLWVKSPEFDNQKGIIDLIGGVAGGLNTSRMTVFRTTFMAKKTGPAEIYADDSSMVFLNDGLGSSLKLSFMTMNFPIVEGVATNAVSVSSNTQPDETKWYTNNNVELQVNPKLGDIYSYSFSTNPEITPNNKQDDISKKLTFDNLLDGIYYFKLASKSGNGNWQEALVRRFQIDTTPPESFTPVVASDPSVYNGQPFVSFTTSDQTSGIDHYEIRFGGIGPWTSTKNTSYVVPKFRLSDKIQVKALDKAGNFQVAEITYNQSNGGLNFAKLLIWFIIIISLILLALLVSFILKHTKIRK